MPEQEDDRTPASVEKRFRELLEQEEHRHPKPGKKEHQSDEIDAGKAGDASDEPEWHKQGRKAPHGWKQAGDTFVEE
jgi:hypothetical protein